ncbi:N-acetylmuramoyl-L-alanine amidase [Planktothrix paucivesiculata]|uniref:N-acetylmuramoyl-L-alanine amidase n=1 Tax=Planktothrix paucivesiculata PCC 9631 TaxID=671071 RepID=A0A7Z9BFM3_9CYAN|nr:N-acetylmuramoyl-L-alanine amidase [Planktothrix paucivesiculata]VXD11761.1 N-acetylmuramoyl-L-alanine amidase [Planktothrix paucivesiculata PCC 9631]
MGKTLFSRWLMPGLVSFFILTSPAEAASLQSWQFESSQNRLSFTTDGGVQPKAQLLSNPARLVIDLPGTSLGGVNRQQLIGGAIREIRVGQVDNQTTRIVVELADGYTLDPQGVQFRGISPTQWTVQLPSPRSLGTPAPAPAPPPPTATRPSLPLPQTPSVRPPAPARVPAPLPQQTVNRSIPQQPQTTLAQVEVRDNGIVLHTTGKMADIEFKQSQDRSWMTLDILGATLASRSNSTGKQVNRDGVTISQVTQLSSNPPVVRVTMSTPKRSQNWQARSSAGGIAVWPQGSTPPAVQLSGGFAKIRSVEIRNQQLLIQADQPLNYSSGWDNETQSYSITFFSAALADGIALPQRQVGSPIIWTRVRREDPETFTLLIKPATRIEVGQISQGSPQQLALAFVGEGLGSRTPAARPPVATVPTPNPRPFSPRTNPPRTNTNPFPFPPRTANPPSNNPIPNGRVAVIIDPGHGGSDPGAVGVGGLREKDIVLSISQQVAQILQQNGVQAVMTRLDDRTIELEPRVDMANRMNATLFVSIHANAATNAAASGIETFYYSSGSRLAQYVQNSVMASFSQLPNRGVKQARFYVLRNTSMPSVLVETGFVTNNYDAYMLGDPAQRSRMAQAIAQGILQYLRDNRY